MNTRRNPFQLRLSRRAGTRLSALWLASSLLLPGLAMMALVSTNASVAVDTTTTEHIVQAGETLGQIAQRYDITIDALVAANGLTDPDRIRIGQVLVIPRESPAGTLYTVEAGDSYSRIASRFDVTVEDLLAANGLSSSETIYAGQQLVIPTVVAAYSVAQSTEYTLLRGESLYRVALQFGVSVDDILAANDIANATAVYPGLTLRIPQPQPAALAEGEAAGAQTGGTTYIVQNDDTLASIALQYGVTVDGLIAANGIRYAEEVFPGQILNIPQAGAVARPAEAETGTFHEVQQGESLAVISLRYGVTVYSLMVANGLPHSYGIQPGTVLSIPSAHAGSHSVSYASSGAGLCEGVEVTRAGTGYFVRPTGNYYISQRFHPWHPGIDLAGDTGDLVYAADGGTVVFAGWNSAGYGNLIVLDHGNGWRTYYAHLNSVQVGCGDFIPRGGLIGLMGTTGNSTGPHLHFEILRYGIAVDPDGYLKF